MYTRKPLNLYSFGSDERGTVAMTFGIMMTALLFFAGMAVDYSRANDVRSRVSDAADAAALAAGRALMEGSLSTGEIQALAIKYFNENVKGLTGQAAMDTPKVTVNPTTGAVTIDVVSRVKLTLARLMGKETLDFPITAAVNFAQKDIEIGMALDVTGSMSEPSFDGGTKIAGLKKAFESFANRLIPANADTAQKVRIGIAPYAHTVNLGDYAYSVTGDNTSKCVTERKNGQYSDALDQYHPLTKKEGKCIGDEAKLVPLTNDREALINTVNGFGTYSSTAGHLGVQWAWNIVSPKWGSSWGGKGIPDSMDRVDEGKLIKAVVLMTDGNFNKWYHGPDSKKQAVALCNAMKSEGIIVFSVSFNGPKEPADTETLKACASEGPGYFADANSAEELEAAFNNFAAKLTALRITK